MKRSAGLPLSVGSASFGVRCFLAVMFALVGIFCLGGAVVIGRTGPLAASILAIVAIVPLACIACIAAAFTIAPFSRFGVWLDHFVGALTGPRLALVFAACWLVGAILVLAG